MAEIIPTIIAKDIDELEQKLKKVESYVKWVQLDIMDGKFVKNITWNQPSDLKNLKTGLNLEAHLMVQKPEEVIDNWVESGVKRIIFHYEATDKHEEIIKKIKEADLEVGIAINPETPVNVLDKFLRVAGCGLRVAFILIMTVHPGKGGQKFLEETLGKIRGLRGKYPNVMIEVDGGVNLETVGQTISAGANLLAVGSAIWGSGNAGEIIEKMKQRAADGRDGVC